MILSCKFVEWFVGSLILLLRAQCGEYEGPTKHRIDRIGPYITLITLISRLTVCP